MLKVIIIAAVVVLILAIASVVIFFMMRGPDLSKYEILKEPRITTMADKKVIEVSVMGEPGKVLKDAFGLLMQAYYKTKGVGKGPNQSAPSLRCNLPEDTTSGTEVNFETQQNWRGTVAISVPDSVTTLPSVKVKPGMEIRLTTWEYGKVAEILHIGKYEDETPTIKKLTEYIAANGYTIVGEHEEEYLRGPGMFFSKPENYYTVIRYRIAAAR